MKVYIVNLLLLVTLIVSFSLKAELDVNDEVISGGTGWRSITAFGCHLVDGTCYFDVSGTAVGPDGCHKRNIRFDSLNSPNGKTWLSLIQIAIATGKKVNFNIATNCYTNQPAYPTFRWGQIEPAVAQ